MPEATELQNDGFIRLLPDGYVQPEERTLIVLGLARGGTTMVARVVQSFGVFMGDECDNPVVEDRRFAAAVEAADEVALADLVADYDATRPVWGAKRPNAFAQLDPSALPFRNPHWIIVFRDILSIANRNLISMFKDPVADMEDSIDLLSSLVRFIDARRGDPMFLFSFDRSLMNPRGIVDELADFCGIDLTPKQRRRALKSIDVDNANYLELSRADSFMGRITEVDERVVRGFFRYHHRDENPPLELYVDDEPVDAEATWFDTHIDRPNGKRFSGRYGFQLTVPTASRIRAGSLVSVIVDDARRQELRNSPYKVR